MKRLCTFIIVAVIFCSWFNVASAQNNDAGALQLYWLTAGRNEISRMPLDGTAAEDTEIIFTGLEGWPLSIDFDLRNRQMYWTQDMKDWTRLLRADLDGTNKQVINVRSNILAGFTVDSTSQEMYWAEDMPLEVEDAHPLGSPWHTLLIQRANLDGTNTETIISNDQENFHPGGLDAAIALDHADGKIYWLSNNDTLYRANLNGTNIEELFLGSVRNGGLLTFALDTMNRKLYMTGDGIIRCANLDGTNMEIITKVLGSPVELVLDVAGGNMYWLEFIFPRDGGRQFKIQRANLDGTNVQTLISGGSELITDIALGPKPPSLIPDQNLAAAVRKALNLPTNAAIPKARLATLTSLEASVSPDAPPEEQISDLAGLEHATRLTTLQCDYSQIRDVGPLAGLSQLRHLVIWSSQIRDVGPLAGLSQLRHLAIWSSQIRDVGPLAGLTQLEHLSLSRNHISDIRPLSGLMQLGHVDLHENQISEIGPLAGLTRLKSLGLADNKISDIRPLSGLTQLEILSLESNQISDVSPLTRLTRLRHLWLDENEIRDVSPLSKLVNLEWLFLSKNPITDTTPLANLTKLVEVDIEITAPSTPNLIPDPNLAAAVRETLGLGPNAPIDTQALQRLTTLNVERRQITNLTGLEHAMQLTNLNLNDNDVSDITPLIGLTKLKDLLMWGNRISDLSSLVGLTNLTRLLLQVNNITDVSPLAGLTNLEYLALDSNLISDISPLNVLAESTHISWSGNPGFPTGGPKITGPWLWVLVPGIGLDDTTDFLALASGGYVTELDVATNGAASGTSVGDSVWTYQKISATGRDNINQLSKRLGWGTREEIYDHIIYGSIRLDSLREQHTSIFVGSDDAIKVWLNGELVHQALVGRAASDYQAFSPVILKQGTNVLLVAIDNHGLWDFSGFFGFALDAEYTVLIPEDINNDGEVNIQDLVLVASNLGETGENDADVNGDEIVDIRDLIDVAAALDTPAAAPALDPQALSLFTTTDVRKWLAEAQHLNLTDPTAEKSIRFLEQLLTTLIPKTTSLLPNYPNPFNPETWIPYKLAKSADVTLTIYAVNGQIIRQIPLGHQSAGIYQRKDRAVYWDGKNTVGERVASSIYFYTLTADNFTATRKMLIRK